MAAAEKDVAAARKVVEADGKKDLRPREKGFLRLMGNDNVVAGKDIQLLEKMLQLPEKMLQLPKNMSQLLYFFFFLARTAQEDFRLTGPKLIILLAFP